MNFGTKLKTAREIKGITAKDMADRLELSIRSYYGYENGETSPSLEKIEAIAKQLEITVPSLLGLDEKQIFNIYDNNNQGDIIGAMHYNFEKERMLFNKLIVDKDNQILALQSENKRLLNIIIDKS
jgi:transcriptional regulator with XRE-family HTH domain